MTPDPFPRLENRIDTPPFDPRMTRMLAPKRSPLSSLALAATLAWAAGLHAAPLSQAGLTFLVRNGSGPSGEPVYAVADSGDSAVKQIWDKVASDPNVLRTVRIYQQIQDQRRAEIETELKADGSLSAQDQQILAGLPTHPVYVEVKPGTAGAYNDWKAQYVVRDPSGSLRTVKAPRIVFQANDPVAVGADRSLLAQTLVHEIAHGFHAQLVGADNTPRTPWLSRPHSGNTTSDGTLALIEGYAEFVAAYLTGRRTIAGDPTDAIPRNLYAYDAEGKPKSADELWATEGWAATVMYEIASSSRIQNGFDKINAVIRRENPSTFKGVVEEYQRQNPADAAAVKSIVATMSFGKIYPESYSGGGQGGGQGGSQGGGQPPLWEGYEDDGDGKTPWGPVLASVAGGVVGALFGVSFGPVGIAVAGAVGAGLGYLLGKALFKGSDGDSPDSPLLDRIMAPIRNLKNGFAGPSSPGLASGPAMDPAAARRTVDEAYLRYKQALSDSDLELEELHRFRRDYESALAGYRAAFGAARD